MSIKPYKLTLKKRALVVEAIALGQVRVDTKVDVHVGTEQALQAKIMGMAQLAEPEEE